MGSIEWSPELSVGNEHIDAQHRDIIRMVNKLVESRDQSLNAADVSSALTNLMQFMKQHFKDEEELMHKNGCPWADEHVKQHVYFAERLTEIFTTADDDLLRKTIPFLRDWLVGHLASEDMRIRPYLR